MRCYKKILATILSAGFVLSGLTACGKEGSTEVTSGGTTEATTEATSGETTSAEPEFADDRLIEKLAADGLIPRETVTLNVYSRLAGYTGELEGWFAKLLLDKFNVKLNLLDNRADATRVMMEQGDLVDIVVWGGYDGEYAEAVNRGLILNWDKKESLKDYGAYIYENMDAALEDNRSRNEDKGLYGFGTPVASSVKDHENIFYTWDIRWDLYEELGHPEVKNLEDYTALLQSMKEKCNTDDQGRETYAVSLWPDWDSHMVMNAKCLATAYYGLDAQGMGLYDVESGDYFDALMENGPYLEALKFYNRLFQQGLLDPESRTQTYEMMSEKVASGMVLSTIFDYAGGNIYNTNEHLSANKLMRPLAPEEASPLVYGLSLYGDSGIWSIGANTKYPELCMAILDYLSTPDGYMESIYGPKSAAKGADATDGCWYYQDGKTYFTDLGKNCNNSMETNMPEELGGGTFAGGSNMINSLIWNRSTTNPVTGESYDNHSWASEQAEPVNATDSAWRKYAEEVMGAGAGTILNEDDYFEARKIASGSKALKLALAINYTEEEMPTDLRQKWADVSKAMNQGSWDAIYAASDEEFDRIVAEMTENCKKSGYDECVEWSKKGAENRKVLEDAVGE